jgi:hypothetical protein
MQRAGRAAAGFRVGFSMALSLALKRGGEARTLLRVIAKSDFKFGLLTPSAACLKAFLTIFERFRLVIDYFVCFFMKR